MWRHGQRVRHSLRASKLMTQYIPTLAIVSPALWKFYFNVYPDISIYFGALERNLKRALIT